MLSHVSIRAFITLAVCSTFTRADGNLPARLKSELQAAQEAPRVNPIIEAAAAVNRAGWTVSADSFQTGNEATNVLDSSTSTIWHTGYSPANVPLPHNVRSF